MAKDSGREALGGRAVVVALAAVVLLLGGGYAAAGAFASDRVPRGTTVAGVAVGGQTPAQARSTLKTELADRVDAPISVSVDGRSVEVDPAEAGLSFDLDASVEAAGGGSSWAPDRLWDYLQKVACEAKLETSWINPSERYERDLEAFVRQLMSSGLSPRSVARIVACVRGFYNFLVLDGHLPGSPADDLRAPRS
ncbi:hypothetical protein [uncultured Nocardioides sp.]|uniref:hypothetical protein n=1 Tax=uncultured Nocardioides sp. TaxID=198441 RepID=UPI002612734E|nr:hypothetical protein [uncultured Nocardioides sp.]